MSTKFYEYENCSENSLINFDKCNSLYGIGNNIKTTEDYSSWNNLENNTLENIIPFLVERKFRYYNKDSRTSISGTPNLNSDYYFYDTPNPIIRNNYAEEELKPDDVIKENIVNNFTDKLFNSSLSFYQNLLFKLTDTQTMKEELNSYYENDIIDLKKELVQLNNNKLTEENNYSSKYYKLKNYETNTNILINSIFIVSLIFVIGVLTNNGIIDYGYIINVILLIVLVIYLLLSLKTIRDRQYSNWDKRYFDYVNDISDKV